MYLPVTGEDVGAEGAQCFDGAPTARKLLSHYMHKCDREKYVTFLLYITKQSLKF